MANFVTIVHCYANHTHCMLHTVAPTSWPILVLHTNYRNFLFYHRTLLFCGFFFLLLFPFALKLKRFVKFRCFLPLIRLVNERILIFYILTCRTPDRVFFSRVINQKVFWPKNPTKFFVAHISQINKWHHEKDVFTQQNIHTNLYKFPIPQDFKRNSVKKNTDILIFCVEDERHQQK